MKEISKKVIDLAISPRLLALLRGAFLLCVESNLDVMLTRNVYRTYLDVVDLGQFFKESYA